MMEGSNLRAQQIIAEMEGLNRALTEEESVLLERSLRRLAPKRDVWRWSAKDDRKLILLIRKRGYSLRIKPFERNDEVQRIAQDMGRSYLAVLKRIERLRRKMQCPNASAGRKR
jgi:hypothetical protein